VRGRWFEPEAGERLEGLLGAPPVCSDRGVVAFDRDLADLALLDFVSVFVKQRDLGAGNRLPHTSGFDLPVVERVVTNDHATFRKAVGVLWRCAEPLLAPVDGILIERFTRRNQHPEVDIVLAQVDAGGSRLAKGRRWDHRVVDVPLFEGFEEREGGRTDRGNSRSLSRGRPT